MNIREKNTDVFIPEYALKVMRALWNEGEEVYIVGGCVRDSLLGIKPHDYDMAVSCEPHRTLEILKDFRTIETGIKHGTVTAISEKNPIELTTFRIDGSYSDSRRPDSVSFTRSLKDDLSRRDFTVNAMAYEPREGLIDLFGGREDISKKIVRAVGNPKKRFEEDALRIMRAFRFSAQLGFDIDHDTLNAARETSHRLANIAKERILSEFVRLICSSNPYKPLCLMKELGIFTYVCDGYAPSDRVLSLLELMPTIDTARLGFFLCEADEKRGADILRALKCSNKQKNGALIVSREAHTPINTKKDAALLRSRSGELALSAVTASVLLGKSLQDAVSLVSQNNAPVSISELAIDGSALCDLGLSGKEIGQTLHYLLDAVIEQPELNTKDILLEMAKKRIIEGE